MSSVQQYIRDNAVYASGYIRGRSFSLVPRSFTDLYAISVAKIARLATLPLPFLSFLALPFFTGTSTTINVFFFYLTWSALVLSHDPLSVEIYGTLTIRLLCFVLPALGFVLLDSGAPNFSKSLKTRGTSQLPGAQLSRNKLLEVSGIAVLNVLLSVLVQLLIEFLNTKVLRLRSILKVTSIVPLPWNILKDVAMGFAFRGVTIYGVHRYLLHEYDSPLKDWHLKWQHSIKLPFSIIAAYDHPVNYLLMQWLPTFLPAYVLRFHVLTWHLFLALCSLEELFVFSGYSIMPSSIVLLGMARRNDEHFASVDDGRTPGNFGRFGLLDFVFGTTCQGEDDAVDDIQTEMEKHRVKQRAGNAVDGAISGIKGKQKSKSGGRGQSKASKS